ncbi:MAG: hypothetical protein AAFY76_08250, partial [Cyanobacteria bacterium J06649_11]
LRTQRASHVRRGALGDSELQRCGIWIRVRVERPPWERPGGDYAKHSGAQAGAGVSGLLSLWLGVAGADVYAGGWLSVWVPGGLCGKG